MRPDEETIGWLFETTAWWVGSFGGFEALALYTMLLDIDDREVTEHLAPNPRGWLRDALRDLRRRRGRELGRIRAIETREGPYR